MNSPSETTEIDARSPCVRVCAINGQGICVGCWRTLDEIAAWSSLTDTQRRTVNVACQERKRQSAGATTDASCCDS